MLRDIGNALHIDASKANFASYSGVLLMGGRRDGLNWQYAFMEESGQVSVESFLSSSRSETLRVRDWLAVRCSQFKTFSPSRIRGRPIMVSRSTLIRDFTPRTTKMSSFFGTALYLHPII